MKAKLVAELMADLGVTKSHSRPLPVMSNHSEEPNTGLGTVPSPVASNHH